MNIRPFIKIVTLTGKEFTNVITNFRYKFSEEDDELCTFCIESDNPMIADDPDLQEGKRLEVSWGYIDGKGSKTRVVFIFDTDPTYGEDGVKIDFTCHEKFVLAKMDTAMNKNTKQLKDVPVIFSPDILSTVSLEIEKGNTSLISLLDNTNIDVNSAYSANNDGGKVVCYYNGNHSTFRGLRTFLDKLPGGPYVIDSRDEAVIVRTRDFKQNSALTYYYNRAQGNPLLRFKPQTKNRSNKSGAEQIDVTSWDPKTKTAITQTSSTNDKGQVKLANSKSMNFGKVGVFGQREPNLMNLSIRKGNVYTNPATLGKTAAEWKAAGGIPVETSKPKPPSTLQKLIKGQQATNAGKDLEKLKGKTVITEGKLATGQTVKKLYVGYDYGKEPAIRGVTVARDNTAVAKPIFDIVVDEIKPTKSILSPESAERARALADNERKNNELKNNPATASMEGDPLLETGIIITVLGVAKKHAGNYYIMDCEHIIDDSGYITECTKMARNGINVDKSSATVPTKTLPSSQYFYELNKPDAFKWEDGDVINISKGQDNSQIAPKTKKIESKKADRS